jgi:hypothetical protein
VHHYKKEKFTQCINHHVFIALNIKTVTIQSGVSFAVNFIKTGGTNKNAHDNESSYMER